MVNSAPAALNPPTCPHKGTCTRSRHHEPTIWVLQILLALAFLAAGLTKLTQPRQKLATTMGWVEDYSDPWVRAIGASGPPGGLLRPALTVD